MDKESGESETSNEQRERFLHSFVVSWHSIKCFCIDFQQEKDVFFTRAIAKIVAIHSLDLKI